MHSALFFFIYWALAFASLLGAVLLLGAFASLVESDAELKTWGKELLLAALASLIEAVTLWLVVVCLPASTRALGLRILILPALIVLILYKLCHLTWNRYESVLLLLFQVGLGCALASLVTGHLLAAAAVLLVLGVAVAAIVSLGRLF